MLTGILPLVSPQTHRRIDQLTFPGLLAASALLSRFDERAAAITLATAGVEGAAYLMTDYPPAVMPLISFRDHNRWATAHGALVIGLALLAPGLTRRGRLALLALGASPITLAAFSDVKGAESRRETGELQAASFSSARL